MVIDFEKERQIEVKNMNNGEGSVIAYLYPYCPERKVIFSRIQPHSSIGTHVQTTGDDVNYVLSGKGYAVYDGIREELKPGVCHICLKGHSHSIVNDSDEELVLFSFVG